MGVIISDKPKLLLDMDGVIADFNRQAIRTYNRYNGTSLDESLCNEYVGNHEVIDSRIDPKLYRKSFKDPGFFLNIPVIKGAQKAILELIKYYTIYVVSTQYRSNQTCVHEKQIWLEKFFPKIADNTIYTKHKYMVKGDILIDDRPENLRDWKMINPNGITASLAYHWSDRQCTNIIAKDWPSLVNRLKELAINSTSQ